ncbi:MAG TPA: type II secretion system F family protein [Candidatus Wujingus californicus]|uniref:type II secretion system F family protein n=2 Tax=Candidatus Wujingus californicus TaxID=3367618 RepID=UPI001DC60344|nr:type II secretion system F family protein [Planctomycetota bacterium]MDO8131343.1 type II secretion system F family protein [Candidatus Brocadiales bacterium]
MSFFAYNAVNKNGQTVKDKIEAPSEGEAVTKIRGLGYFPVSIKEISISQKTSEAQVAAKAPAKKLSGISIPFGKIKTKNITAFTRQLSTLQNAGLPIIRGLKILEKQMKRGLFKKTITKIVEDIESGSTLSNAFARHTRIFDKLYVSIVKAGEVSGSLDIILRRLAEFREKMERLIKKIIGATIYPAVVMFVSVSILMGLMIFVVPNFTKIFEELNLQLPTPTRILITVSTLLKTNWMYIPSIPFGTFILYKILSKIKNIKILIDRAKFKIPILGVIVNKSSVSRFTRTLATLISSGVPILEALNNVREATGNAAMASAIQGVHDSVKTGESIAKPLRKAKICDEIVINMIEVGEETGELDKMLNKIADNYDEEVDRAVETMVSLIEPIMIVFLGGSVGFIVIAMFIPLIKLMQSISPQ